MGLGEPSVLLIGTLDTKGPEVDYLRSRLHALGVPTLVMDTGILGEPLSIEPDVSHADLAEFGGTTLEALQQDRKSTRLNSSHSQQSRMPSSA